MKRNIIVGVCSIAVLGFLAAGCEEAEDNKIAQAQECLDKLKDTDSDTAAEACESKISGITTPESYVIRCGIRFFVGGLKTQTMIDAYEDYENAATNDKAAVLMNALAQDSTGDAQATFAACEKSGVSSLIYVASASLIGTSVKFLGAGGNLDAQLADCQANGCDDAEVGAAVLALHDAYCLGDAQETQVCSEVASAIENAGGENADPAAIADYLYGLLQ